MTPRRRTRRFVEALLRGRRPPRFEADAEEARLLRAATALRGARTGADLPSADFVTGLEERLRAQLDPAPSASPASPSRRNFLIGGGVAAAAAAAVAVDLAVRHTEEQQPDRTTQAELVPTDGTWHQVATLADLADGRPRRFSAGAVEGVLVPQAGGGVAALSAVCTHRGCLLQAQSTRLLCPCHGASFDLRGFPVDHEYLTSPLPTLRSRVVDGRVEVLVV